MVGGTGVVGGEKTEKTRERSRFLGPSRHETPPAEPAAGRVWSERRIDKLRKRQARRKGPFKGPGKRPRVLVTTVMPDRPRETAECRVKPIEPRFWLLWCVGCTEVFKDRGGRSPAALHFANLLDAPIIKGPTVRKEAESAGRATSEVDPIERLIDDASVANEGNRAGEVAPGHRVGKTDNAFNAVSPNQFKGSRKKVSLRVARFLVGKHKAPQLYSVSGGNWEGTCEDGVRAWVRENRDANQGAMTIEPDSKSHGGHGARVVMCDDEIAGGGVVRDFGDFVIRRPDGFSRRPVRGASRDSTAD